MLPSLPFHKIRYNPLMTASPTFPSPWWPRAIFYQVYPRSFADGNGDGIGDLPGLTANLDYLQDLGVDALWLSPHYPSPQVDVGYDIADYCLVNPEYGTLDDFRCFLNEAHCRGLKVVTDLVLNHTSDQHPWFQESRSSKTHPRRNWYIWRPGRGDGPPNNWLSAFGGSAWTLDPLSGEYYYHLFLKEQPDLNWRSPAVKEAMWEAARFWLDLGVDGFRLDAIDTLYEHPNLPDHPVERSQSDLRHYLLSASSEQRKQHGDQERIFQYQVNQPGAVGLMRELRSLVEQYPGRVLVGESDRLEFLGDGRDCLHMVFNFPLLNMGQLYPEKVHQNLAQRLAAIPPGGWNANTLGNHDRPRTISAHTDGVHDQELARLSLAMLLTLPGTPFLYYGEEIGMTDYLLQDSSQIRDRASLWVYTAALEQGISPDEALRMALDRGRDRCRTPMQWANIPNAGFSPSNVLTWLPVNPDYQRGINVQDQLDDPTSLLSCYRCLLHLRRDSPALQAGSYQTLALPEHKLNQDILAYTRHLPGQPTHLVLLNFSSNTQYLDLSSLFRTALCTFSTHHQPGTPYPLANLSLAPFEAFFATLLT
jgi:alpha-glucosidase